MLQPTNQVEDVLPAGLRFGPLKRHLSLKRSMRMLKPLEGGVVLTVEIAQRSLADIP